MKILFSIIFILLIIYLFNKKENYTNPSMDESILFKDVSLYIGDKTLEGELGLEKCINSCKGMCVEYGVTGDAFCFPNDNHVAFK